MCAVNTPALCSPWTPEQEKFHQVANKTFTAGDIAPK